MNEKKKPVNRYTNGKCVDNSTEQIIESKGTFEQTKFLKLETQRMQQIDIQQEEATGGRTYTTTGNDYEKTQRGNWTPTSTKRINKKVK